jgi:glutamyl-Q tRNA(Asp) synthetase
MATPNPAPVYRFAPSPNGELHLGHAYSALLNLHHARENNGHLLLRIEDIDTVRCTPELEAQMLADLEWIGFEWDGEPRRQSEHFDEYQTALDTLFEMELVYPALLSRGDIKKRVKEFETNGATWPHDPDGSPHYPGTERDLSQNERAKLMASGKPYALRLNMQKALEFKSVKNLHWQETRTGSTHNISAKPEEWGDVIVSRKDTPTSYHLCCVLDDALQGVTHIVRGSDLYEATSVHRLLQTILEIEPPIYHHHQLIMDEQGNKLSKSTRSTSIRALRDAGYSRDDLIAKLPVLG